MPDGRAQVVPTVFRVTPDTLVELVYDASARKTALAVSRFGGLWNIEQEVRLETGELLVPYAANNNLIKNECLLLAQAPSEYGLKVELLADIQSYIHRYVDLSPTFETIAAHYVLLSWVYDRFGELPYLRLQGEYGTGKTRGLLAIGSICNKPFFASGASTTSPIFHTLNAFGGTLILDEADFPYSDAKADLIKVFNNGTVPGIPVLRCVPNKYKEYNPAAFKVFGPKIIAMRERFQDDALESRFITEATGHRPLREDVPLHLPPSLKAEALALRNRLLHFRFCEYFKINPDPGLLARRLDPRLNQTALALLSLMDEPMSRDAVQALLISQSAALRARRRDSIEAGIVRALQKAFNADRATPTVPLMHIVEHFNAINILKNGCRLSNKQVGFYLRRRLGIASRKIDGRYCVPRSEEAKLEALARRYALPDCEALDV